MHMSRVVKSEKEKVTVSREKEISMLGRNIQCRMAQITPNEYQELAMVTVNTSLNRQQLLGNAAMGLSGESGEVADIIKKHFYQGHELDKNKVAEELGDLMWYVALMAQVLDTDLETIMLMNVDKLKERFPDGFSEVRSINR